VLLVVAYPLQRFVQYSSRRFACQNGYRAKTNHDINACAGQVHMRRLMVFFPKLQAVLSVQSDKRCHALIIAGIAKMAIALCFLKG